MKKINVLALLLVAVFALSMFGSCKHNNDNSASDASDTSEQHVHAFSEAWTYDADFHWHAATCGHSDTSGREAHTMLAGRCTVCGYEQECTLTADTDFDALVSDRVTEEEWRAIFTDEKFKNVTMEETDGYESNYILRDCTDTRWSCMVTYAGVDQCVVYENNINMLYVHMDEWYYMQVETSMEEMEQGTAIHFTYICYDFSANYDTFTYDVARGVYRSLEEIRVATSPFEYFPSTLEHVELKFKDGYLACVYVDGRNDEHYYDYGKTKVVPPEDAIPFPEEPEDDDTLTADTDFDALVSDRVTEEEWREVLAVDKFKNVSLDEICTTYYPDDEEEDYEDDYLYFNTRVDWQDTQWSTNGRYALLLHCYDDSYDEHYYDIWEDGKNTTYDPLDGNWYYTPWETTQDVIDSMEENSFFENTVYSFDHIALIDNYSAFTYDEERGMYIYEAPEESDGIEVGMVGDYGYAVYIELKIKGGFLAYCCIRSDYDDLVYQYFYDYGRTEVIPPEDALPDYEKRMTQDESPRFSRSAEVTEEEWIAAFSEENFENFCVNYFAHCYSDIYFYYFYPDIIFDGKNAEEDISRNDPYRFMKEVDGRVLTWKGEGMWPTVWTYVGETALRSMDETITDENTFLSSLVYALMFTKDSIPYSLRYDIVNLKDKFSYFTFDAEKRVYRSSEIFDGTTLNIVMRQGRLAGIWWDYETVSDEGQPITMSYSITFYDYGKAHVELPADIEY